MTNRSKPRCKPRRGALFVVWMYGWAGGYTASQVAPGELSAEQILYYTQVVPKALPANIFN